MLTEAERAKAVEFARKYPLGKARNWFHDTPIETEKHDKCRFTLERIQAGRFEGG